MTRRTPSETKVRTQHSQSFKVEALGFAEKVGLAQAAADLASHFQQVDPEAFLDDVRYCAAHGRGKLSTEYYW